MSHDVINIWEFQELKEKNIFEKIILFYTQTFSFILNIIEQIKII